jgi:uncharacterized damage-inducible protein DinB
MDTAAAGDSMLLGQYRAFARYNSWMNAKLYGVCGELTDEERKRDLGAFFRSVHATLNHLLLGDRSWLTRFTGDRQRFQSLDSDGKAIELRSLDQELYTDFDVLRRERERTDREIEDWTAGLTAERLRQTIAYRTTAGVAYEHPLWWGVAHFFNHQTHHRGQVTTLLSQLGHDPGVTDLIALLRG